MRVITSRLTSRLTSRFVSRFASRMRTRLADEAGMTTAEYAVGTVAACGFAALLYKVVTSAAVSGALTDLVKKALTLAS